MPTWSLRRQTKRRCCTSTATVHEVTSPQAFDGLRAHHRPVRQPWKTFATMDHNVSTQTKDINASGEMARIQMQELIKNCNEFGVELYDLNHPYQGIVHVMGPNRASPCRA